MNKQLLSVGRKRVASEKGKHRASISPWSQSPVYLYNGTSLVLRLVFNNFAYACVNADERDSPR